MHHNLQLLAGTQVAVHSAFAKSNFSLLLKNRLQSYNEEKSDSIFPTILNQAA